MVWTQILSMCALWPWPWRYDMGSRSWHTLGSCTIIVWNIQIQHVSKVKVRLWTLPLKSCRFTVFTASKLRMHVTYDERRWYFLIIVGTNNLRSCHQSSRSTLALFPWKFDGRYWDQMSRLWHTSYNILWTRYRKQYFPNHMKTS